MNDDVLRTEGEDILFLLLQWTILPTPLGLYSIMYITRVPTDLQDGRLNLINMGTLLLDDRKRILTIVVRIECQFTT